MKSMTIKEAAAKCQMSELKLRTSIIAGECPFAKCALPEGRKQRTYTIYPARLDLYIKGQLSEIDKMPENVAPVYVGNYRKE